MVCLTAALGAQILPAQTLGSYPPTDVGAMDINLAFRLPAMADTAGSPLEQIVSQLQVGRRAIQLGLNSKSATEAWTQAQKLLTPVATPRATARTVPVFQFSGGTASALNQILAMPGVAAVVVTSATLSIDQPIEIQRNGLSLDLGTAQIISANSQAYMVRIEHAANVALLNGNFTAGNSAVLISGANAVAVNGLQISGLSGTGIVVTGSTRITVANCSISGLQLAGIIVHRGTSQSVVEHNQIIGNNGFSNMMAGIVVSDREVDLTSDPRALLGPDGYWVVQEPMSQRLHPPHDNLIAWNHVARNSSSGIYLDGGTRIVVYANSVVGNSKEGLCLDNGSTANVVAANMLQQNGQRWGEPDSVMALDSVLGGGRLPDGSAAEKVPGISLDNAIYNIVFANNVLHNFGGGIKIVRTGYFNEIGLNLLLDDNDGAGAAYHFFGVELGAAPGDNSSAELDFTPSKGNLVFSNSIRGTHYSGIFFDAGSDSNNIFDNTILDATAWALESSQQMNNVPLDNYTNLPSRNIGSGLSPALLVSGQPVNDPQP